MISGLLSAAGAIMTFKDSYDSSKAGTWDEKIIDATQRVVSDRKFPLMKSDGNMIRFLSGFIVEPVIIVTKDVNREDISQRIMELNTDIFCSFYMQTFEVLRNLYGVDPMSAVQLLSTDGDTVIGKAIKSAGGYAMSDYTKIKHTVGMESFVKTKQGTFTFGLESIDKNKLFFSNEEKEFDNDHATDIIIDVFAKISDDHREHFKTAYGLQYKDEVTVRSLYKSLSREDQSAFLRDVKRFAPQTDADKMEMVLNAKEAAPLISEKDMGKDSLLPTILFRNFEVNVGVPVYNDPNNPNDKNFRAVYNFKLPITVKAHIIVCDADDLANMIAPNGDDKSFGARWDDWRSGAIGLKDLLFAGDLIKQYKDNKLKDKNKLIDLLTSRADSAAAKTVDFNAAEKKLTANAIGFEKYYNMIIFSSDDKPVLEKAIGGKLNDRKYIEKFLVKTGSLLYSQIDLNHERVDIEMSGKIGHSSVDFKTLSKRRNSGTQDFSEILKALMMNRPPVF